MGSATRKIANAFSTSGIIRSANINNASLDNITSISGAGDMVLISSATASSSASIEFSLGNYKEYQFYFVNMHPQTNGFLTQFNLSTDGGSNYNVVKTSTTFRPFHYENDAATELAYNTSNDLAQSTAYQPLCENQGNNNDDSMSGHLILFNPSSSTYVKHWISNVNMSHNTASGASVNWYTAGYANTTSPLTNIKFQMSSGNIDAGKILMFGIN